MIKKLILTAKVLVLTSLLSTGFFGAKAQQSYDFPSDRAALPYNVDEVVDVIKTALESPQEENEYVQMVLSEQGFPASEVGEVLKKSDVKRITKWVQEHPAAIEKLLIARKKNYDLFYQRGKASSVTQ